MNHEKTKNSPEYNRDISLEAPPLESFLDPVIATEYWPQEVTQDPDFIKQIVERKKINDSLKTVLESIPQSNMDLQSALSQKFITEVKNNN